MNESISEIFSHEEYPLFAKFLKENKIFGEIKDEIYIQALKEINPLKYKKYIDELKEINPLKLPFDELINLLIENKPNSEDKDKKNDLMRVSEFFYEKLWKNKMNDDVSFAIDEENKNLRVTILGKKTYLKIEDFFSNKEDYLCYFATHNNKHFVIEYSIKDTLICIVPYDLISKEAGKIINSNKDTKITKKNEIINFSTNLLKNKMTYIIIDSIGSLGISHNSNTCFCLSKEYGCKISLYAYQKNRYIQSLFLIIIKKMLLFIVWNSTRKLHQLMIILVIKMPIK